MRRRDFMKSSQGDLVYGKNPIVLRFRDILRGFLSGFYHTGNLDFTGIIMYSRMVAVKVDRCGGLLGIMQDNFWYLIPVVRRDFIDRNYKNRGCN